MLDDKRFGAQCSNIRHRLDNGIATGSTKTGQRDRQYTRQQVAQSHHASPCICQPYSLEIRVGLDQKLSAGIGKPTLTMSKGAA